MITAVLALPITGPQRSDGQQIRKRTTGPSSPRWERFDGAWNSGSPCRRRERSSDKSERRNIYRAENLITAALRFLEKLANEALSSSIWTIKDEIKLSGRRISAHEAWRAGVTHDYVDAHGYGK
jgi:hypothetical protein